MPMNAEMRGKVMMAWRICELLSRHAYSGMPEARLFLAILLQAVYDSVVAHGLVKHRAVNYFKYDGHYWICDLIGLCPIWVSEIMRDHAGIK